MYSRWCLLENRNSQINEVPTIIPGIGVGVSTGVGAEVGTSVCCTEKQKSKIVYEEWAPHFFCRGQTFSRHSPHRFLQMVAFAWWCWDDASANTDVFKIAAVYASLFEFEWWTFKRESQFLRSYKKRIQKTLGRRSCCSKYYLYMRVGWYCNLMQNTSPWFNVIGEISTSLLL